MCLYLPVHILHFLLAYLVYREIEQEVQSSQNLLPIPTLFQVPPIIKILL